MRALVCRMTRRTRGNIVSQKFALILRRTFPRLVPRGVYDHSPTPRSPRQRIAQNRPEIRRAPPLGIGRRAPDPQANGPPPAGPSLPLTAKLFTNFLLTHLPNPIQLNFL